MNPRASLQVSLHAPLVEPGLVREDLAPVQVSSSAEKPSCTQQDSKSEYRSTHTKVNGTVDITNRTQSLKLKSDGGSPEGGGLHSLVVSGGGGISCLQTKPWRIEGPKEKPLK